MSVEEFLTELERETSMSQEQPQKNYKLDKTTGEVYEVENYQKDNKVEEILIGVIKPYTSEFSKPNSPHYSTPTISIMEAKQKLTSILNQRDTELKEKIEKHHLAELEELKNSNNQETTKEYIKKGFEVYKTQLINIINNTE